jgi:hypothetical protein
MCTAKSGKVPVEWCHACNEFIEGSHADMVKCLLHRAQRVVDGLKECGWKQEDFAAALGKMFEEDNALYWCEGCGSYHHLKNPSCVEKV